MGISCTMQGAHAQCSVTAWGGDEVGVEWKVQEGGDTLTPVADAYGRMAETTTTKESNYPPTKNTYNFIKTPQTNTSESPMEVLFIMAMGLDHFHPSLSSDGVNSAKGPAAQRLHHLHSYQSPSGEFFYFCNCILSIWFFLFVCFI